MPAVHFFVRLAVRCVLFCVAFEDEVKIKILAMICRGRGLEDKMLVVMMMEVVARVMSTMMMMNGD